MEVQRLNKQTKDEFALAHKYYQIISVLNDLKLADGQLQLVAFTAIKGNISDPIIRKEYCKRYKTTPATINNVVDKMKKKGVMIKKNKVIFVNPMLTKVDFSKLLTLVISMGSIIRNPTVVEETRQSMELKNESVLNVNKHG